MCNESVAACLVAKPIPRNALVHVLNNVYINAVKRVHFSRLPEISSAVHGFLTVAGNARCVVALTKTTGAHQQLLEGH